MDLMEEIRAYSVPQESMTLWWLGQMSFIIKSPKGEIVAIDPYLTNSAEEKAARAGFNMGRRFPPLIEPTGLKATVVVFTHSHPDHCDPATIEGYRAAGGNGPYVAPAETMEKLIQMGVPSSEVIHTWPNKKVTCGDVALKATFAIPYGADDLTHVGYLVSIDRGPTAYFTGDTDYHDLLGYVYDYKPDLMVTVINGALRNLGPNEAAKLTKMVNPKLVVPCHYDLFPDNSLDPRLFRTCLHAMELSERLRVLDHGKAFTFSKFEGAN